MILLLFLILSQLFAPQLGGTHFLPCLLRVDSRAQQRPGAMPCLGLGTRGKEKETQAHFAEDVLSRQTGHTLQFQSAQSPERSEAGARAASGLSGTWWLFITWPAKPSVFSDSLRCH